MSKRTAAKHKIDRRMGENLWGRPKSPVNRREYGPGEHGQRRKAKLSDFGIQLRAKQKLKGYYGDLTEKQLQYCAKDVIYLHEIYEGLNKILVREKRDNLYKDAIKFIYSRVNLDLASFTSDIWSH